MQLEDVEFKEENYKKIEELLDENFGDVSFSEFDEDKFIYFLATAIKLSYRVGFLDGYQSK